MTLSSQDTNKSEKSAKKTAEAKPATDLKNDFFMMSYYSRK